ncbi:MAG: hypothetical protein GC166_13180 [Alphaproteobacteria bacterium]|nr:hypothetical protein [Alphaproteobacteria bacterium]
MARLISALFPGVLTAFVIRGAFEWIGLQIWVSQIPTADGEFLLFSDFIGSLPSSAFAFFVAEVVAASFCSSAVTTFVARRGLWPGLLTGAASMISILAGSTFAPQPAWMIATNLTVAAISATAAAFLFVTTKRA